MRLFALVLLFTSACSFDRSGGITDATTDRAIDTASDVSIDATTDRTMGDGPQVDAPLDVVVDQMNDADAARRDPCPGDPSLLACYTFDGDTNDGSMYGRHLSGVAIDFPDGQTGQSVRVGLTSTLTIGADIAFDGGEFTLEAWVYLENFGVEGTRAGIIDKDDRFSIFIYANRHVRCDPEEVYSISTVLDQQWTYLVCTFAAGGTTGYFNGAQESVGPAGNLMGTVGMPVAIGRNSPANNEHFEGRIDTLRIWNRVLSTTEIERNYRRATSGR